MEDPEFETVFGRSRQEFRWLTDRLERQSASDADLRTALSHISWLLLYPGASQRIESRLQITRHKLQELREAVAASVVDGGER